VRSPLEWAEARLWQRTASRRADREAARYHRRSVTRMLEPDAPPCYHRAAHGLEGRPPRPARGLMERFTSSSPSGGATKRRAATGHALSIRGPFVQASVH
jgi:hypothetical protein